MGYHPEGYYDILKKVMKKHKRNFNKIYTTCGDWSTSTPLIIQRGLLTFHLGINYLKRKISDN
jgi:hypothetical protein